LDKFCRIFPCDLSDRSDLNPLSEFVGDHKDVLVASRGGSERPMESRPHMEKGHDGGIVRRI
jgi:hypothetical protein